MDDVAKVDGNERLAGGTIRERRHECHQRDERCCAMGGAVHDMGDAKRRAHDGRRSVQRSIAQGRRWARRAWEAHGTGRAVERWQRVVVVVCTGSATAVRYWTVVVEKKGERIYR
ncbi:hypothetical protein U1Q18_013818 [Sarracenia purpurea var. burkii]